MNGTAYLERIAYAGSTQPTLATLRALQRAHLCAVPFENLDIIAGQPLRFDVPALFEKIVARRRGGFCYELNTLFAALLGDLGFSVSTISARVAREGGGFSAPFDHMALIVQLEEAWLVDVGFGAFAMEPLRLEPNAPQTIDAETYRIIEHEGALLVQLANEGGWKNEYLFDRIERATHDFREMMRYHQTSPESPFTQRAIASRPTSGGRITLSGTILIRTNGASRTEEDLNEDQRAAALQEIFRPPVRG